MHTVQAQAAASSSSTAIARMLRSARRALNQRRLEHTAEACHDIHRKLHSYTKLQSDPSFVFDDASVGKLTPSQNGN